MTLGASCPTRGVVSNPGKGIQRNLTTNDAGLFAAGSLVPAGDYRVVISKAGFTGYEAKDIELLVGQNLTVDATLNVAGTIVQVEVETAAPLIEQTRMDVSQVITLANSNLPITDDCRLLRFAGAGVVPMAPSACSRSEASPEELLPHDGNDTTTNTSMKTRAAHASRHRYRRTRFRSSRCWSTIIRRSSAVRRAAL